MKRTPMLIYVLAIASLTPQALASPTAANASGQGAGAIADLFFKSFDVFTVALVLGSFVAAALVVRCVLDIRTSQILPQDSIDRMNTLLAEGRMGEFRNFVQEEGRFAGTVIGAALADAELGREAMLEAAEIAASEETARWFRKIELLGLIGNLGPLVGLAGTVWGMVIAFNALSATAGQAGPEQLAFGISKALFHTLLGLVLAIPCLLIFGVYRSAVDRICTRGIRETSRIVEKLIAATEETAEHNG